MQSLVTPVVAFKTLAPPLEAVIDRPRLLLALARSAAPARWIDGPPGAGKSTLAACHAVRLGRPAVWYRFDERDDDPAFFHANFAHAVDACLPAGAPLPRFSPDDRHDEARFAARLRDAVKVRAAQGALLVFDDLHRVARPQTHAVVAGFCAAAGPSLDVLCVSEEGPPADYFDAIACRQLAVCNDVDWTFTDAECAALAHRAGLDGVTAETLASLTGGHAVALVLACELLRGRELRAQERDGVADRIHLHLLQRVLAGMPDARRHLLLQTAWAPQFTRALATDLAGSAAAIEVDALVARGLLRRTATPRGDVFEAHGVVRRGADVMLRRELDGHALAALGARTANALEAHGFADDAFALWIAQAQPERAADLLAAVASDHARAGELENLIRAIDQLPAALRERRPWLSFWAGQAWLRISEESARPWLEAAYAGFEATGDAQGMRMAAASVVTAYALEYGDLRGLDRWLARYAKSGGDVVPAPGAPFESTLCLAALCAALVRGSHPDGVDPAGLVRRTRALIDMPDAWLTRDEPVQAARMLVEHARIFETSEHAQALVVATRAVVEHGEAGALQRGRWLVTAAWAYFEDGQPEAAAPFLAKAQELVAQSASPRLAFELAMARVDADLKRHAHADAVARLQELESLAVHAPPAQRAEHARLAARVLLLGNRLPEGLRWAQHALEAAALAGYEGGNLRQFELECVYGLAANERYDEAVALAERMRAALDAGQRDAVDAIVAALQCLRDGPDDHQRLARALDGAARNGFVNLLARARPQIARLCATALDAGIQPAFVQRIIEVQQLPPPPGAGPSWPWPVRIRALGGFALEIGGERYRPAHKAQEKPLDLLKLLVSTLALGRSSTDRDWIADRLWPDADTAGGRKSLDMALSRLRKLLLDDRAVILSEGRLMLDPATVWVDVAALQRAVSMAGERRDALAAGRAALDRELGAELAAVLDLVRGPFLPDEDAPWILAARETLAANVRASLVIADALLAGGHDDAVVPAAERAFAADPTSEDLARLLMRAHARAGERGEALRVYRRLRDMLSIVLSLRPSPETERLKDSIYAEAPADGASVTARG